MRKKMNELFYKVIDLHSFLDSICDIFEDFSNLIDSDILAKCLDMLYDFSGVVCDFVKDLDNVIKEI